MATLLAVFVRTFLVQAFVIPSDSMAPGLVAGDHILVNKFIYRDGRGASLLPRRDVRRGDVVVFVAPDLGSTARGTTLIKRCAALPGETLEIDSRSYAVPPDHYFFLGDHRDRSRDSRTWGPVSAERLIGRAVLVYWSVGARKPIAESGGRWSKMKRLAGLPVEWLLRSRWQRCFRPVR